MAADMDCLAWSNEQSQLCYNCDSCKAGLLANLKKEWRRADILLLMALVALICVYLVGCCAFRNAKTEDLFRKYKQGYVQYLSLIKSGTYSTSQYVAIGMCMAFSIIFESLYKKQGICGFDFLGFGGEKKGLMITLEFVQMCPL